MSVKNGSPSACDLENGEQRETWRDRHRGKSEHAEKRQRSQRERNPEPFQKTAGQKDLNNKGDAVDPDLQIGEEHRAICARFQGSASESRLLKICPGRRDCI